MPADGREKDGSGEGGAHTGMVGKNGFDRKGDLTLVLEVSAFHIKAAHKTKVIRACGVDTFTPGNNRINKSVGVQRIPD